MVKASIAVLWAVAAAAVTATLCQAFHVPIRAGSRSGRRLQRQHRKGRNHHAHCRRHSCNTAGVVGQRRGRSARVVARSAAEEAVEVDTNNTKSEEEVEGDAVVAGSIKEAGKVGGLEIKMVLTMCGIVQL